MPKRGTVYILASRIEGFMKEHAVHRLVYVEEHDDFQDTITREKQLKKWNRAWKLRLINETNPAWRDLYELLNGGSLPARG